MGQGVVARVPSPPLSHIDLARSPRLRPWWSSHCPFFLVQLPAMCDAAGIAFDRTGVKVGRVLAIDETGMLAAAPPGLRTRFAAQAAEIPIEAGSEFDQTSDPRYAGVDVPLTECLADVIPRMMPYWENDIQADLRDGKVVLVTAHGNSLRALVKHLDGISDEDIAGLNIPTGMPLVYELDDDFMPTKPGEYLDPEAAAAAAAAVANQGR